jgi:hypothetical protein
VGQVLRYLPGQKYDAHHDYFDPELYKGQPEMLKMVEGGERNRLATLLWYMAAPEEGGETHFPRAGMPQSVQRRPSTLIVTHLQAASQSLRTSSVAKASEERTRGSKSRRNR